MQTTALKQLVRPMRLGDIPQVMEIEHQSFPTMWPPTAFKREIQQNRLARYLVAVHRRADADEAPPTNGAGHPEISDGRPLTRPDGRPLGRFLGGLRNMLEPDALPPIEERDELVVGFIGVWMLIDEAHVVTVAVRDGYRGRGVGELLLIAALEASLKERQAIVTLECRVSNDVALNLYEKYGFSRVGLRPRYYSDNQEDAYILTVEEIDSPAYERRFGELREEHRRRSGEYEVAV